MAQGEGQPRRIQGRKVRVGFLLGKDGDPVPVGQHPRGAPRRLRCVGKEAGWGGGYHVDLGMAWLLKQRHADEMDVDFITLKDWSPARFQRNDINFIVGADLISAMLEDPEKGHRSKFAKMAQRLLLSPKFNVFPSPKMQDWIYHKSRYMKQCMKAGIPILPTLFTGPMPDSLDLLRKIRRRGWKKFIVKPEVACWSIGFLAVETAQCEKDLSILDSHFQKTDAVAGYLVQEFVESTEHPGQSFEEIRTYWFNGYFSHAALTTGEDEGSIVGRTIDGITIPPPKSDLVEAIALGRRAIGEALKVSTFRGKKTAPVYMRVDIGIVSAGTRVTGLEPGRRTFFVNEIENAVANCLTRYFANDKRGLKGKAYHGFRGIDVQERFAEAAWGKIRELCWGETSGDTMPRWFPQTFGDVPADVLASVASRPSTKRRPRDDSPRSLKKQRGDSPRSLKKRRTGGA